MKDIEKISGIYKILNKVNGKYYVGSSQSIKERWKKHIRCLNKKTHWNSKLQNAWVKYGENNFEFVIVEELPIENLLTYEQIYLNECRLYPDKNYMISYDSTAPMRGKIPWNKGMTGFIPWNKGMVGMMPPSWNKGIPQTEETKQKLSIAAQKQFTSEFKRKHSLLCNSIEHRSKISNGKKDLTSHMFRNTRTGEIFIGCKYDWYMKIFGKRPCNIDQFFKGIRKKLKGWQLIPAPIDYEI